MSNKKSCKRKLCDKIFQTNQETDFSLEIIEVKKAFGKTELSLKDLARYIKDVTRKDRAELPMEVIYDAFEIPVPISPPELMEVSPTPLVLKVSAPQKLLIPQIPPAKKWSYRKVSGRKKSQMTMSQPQKEEVLSKFFMGKLAQGEWL